MQLLQQLASALPLESPWTAAIVFGALAWLPIRTIALKIRRWRRKDMDRSILRGGRFTRERDIHDHTVLALAIRTVVQYAIACCSWKKKVLFEKHSDGSVLSRRYVYDRQKAPQDAVLQVQSQTPSPVIPRKRRSRVATPTTKSKSSSSNDKENENPITAPGVDTMAPPLEGKSKASRNHLETTSTRSHQPIDFRVSPYDRSKKPNQGLVMVPYRPQSVPLAPEAKQPSFLDKPLDPHFFQAYAPKRSFIMQVNPSAIQNGSSNNKKRKLDVDTFEGPRKRPSLTRARDSGAFRRKPADPQKRKAREEELLLEFSRKRPKKEDKKVESAVKVVPNPFAPATEDGKSDGKPTFQFGASSVTTAATSDDKKSDGKPVFQFGSIASTTGASDDNKSDGKPAFQFGAATTTTGASDDNKTDGKPAFQFGATTTTTNASDDSKSDGNPAFQFGAASSSTTSSTGTSVQPAFQFGAASVSSLTDAPAGDSVVTAQAADVQKPTFTFGASASAAPGPSVPLSTGAPVTATDTSAPKPAFSFGSSAHAESAGAPQPAFAFGGAATVGNSSNPFSFGGSGATAAFGAPGSATLPGPVNRGGALRRRAGRTVGGRSLRRGTA